MRLGILGYGNMGESFAKALKGYAEITILEIDQRKAEKALVEGFGVAKNIDFLLKASQWLLLAVKPKDAVEVLRDLKERIGDRLLISIVAGLGLSKIEEILGTSKLIRLMPNVNAIVGKATMAVAFGKGVDQEERIKFVELFSKCGGLYELSEDLFDSFTALAGSGPAFVFKFIHALALSGVREGLSYDLAKSIAIDTVLGSCLLLKEKGGHPEDWITKVASPGGTTIEGLKVLEERGFSGIVMECIEKTASKSKRLV